MTRMELLFVVAACISSVPFLMIAWHTWRDRRARRRRADAKLFRWKTKWTEYRQWLAEFPDVALVLDNLLSEVNGEQLDACHPPGPNGPWPVNGLRTVMRNAKDSGGKVQLNESDPLTACDVPPIGWRCTRGKGHAGPCAAVERRG